METQPKPWYASYKLIAAVVGVALIFANAFINHQTIDPNVVTQQVSLVIGAYIAAKAWEDGEQAKARAAIHAANVTAAQPTPPTVGIDATNVNVTPTEQPKPRVESIGLV